DHQQLLDVLAGIKGKFLLSGYRSDLYDSFTEQHRWHRVDIELPNNAAGGKSKRRMVESVWMNFVPSTTAEKLPETRQIVQDEEQQTTEPSSSTPHTHGEHGGAAPPSPSLPMERGGTVRRTRVPEKMIIRYRLTDAVEDFVDDLKQKGFSFQ